MDEKIESNRSNSISWIIYRNKSIFIKFVNYETVYEYENFEYEKFKMMKNSSNHDISYSLGRDVNWNVKVPYGDNFTKQSLSCFE